jgi:phosphatidylserine/phosphatidylglycerophosphate/cardiolipin synthase-like enzyme
LRVGLTPRIALAVESSAVVAARSETVSVVWTGPTAPKAFPVRRSDQALLGLIASATKRVTVVSFVIFKVADITTALRDAANRGVAVDLIFESEPEAKAKSAREMRDAIGKTTGTVRLLEWPVNKRPPKPSGKLGSLHAKCAIADGKRLLVSSANLTELAHWFNVELGLLVEGGDVPRRVQAHFDALVDAGHLTEA